MTKVKVKSVALCLSLNTLLILIFTKLSFAQSVWKKPEMLYKDSNIAVEIIFDDGGNSCIAGNEPINFKYRFNGYVVNDDKYVVYKIDYIDCDGLLYEETKSIQIGGIEMVQFFGANRLYDNFIPDPVNSKIICTSIVTPFHDVTTSNRPIHSKTRKVPPKSSNPISILGVQKILYGESATLTVNGGYLGDKANWYWYEGACGINKVGTGKSITVKPIKNTMYFVRAEGSQNITLCAEIKIDVDLNSKAPNEIEGKTNICKGESITLTVIGGHLGPKAEWCWYTSENKNIKFNTGRSISVSPVNTTTYFVRAESIYNTTPFVNKEIFTWSKSQAPEDIIYSGSIIVCEGEAVNLRVIGGKLSDDADWRWYQGYCGGTSIGSGSVLSTIATSTTTYFVRGEGLCYNTDCISTPISVKAISKKADEIQVPKIIFKNKEFTLEVKGGKLGENAKWIWTKDGCQKGKEIGSGSPISVKISKPTFVSVKATGQCNETECTSIRLNPVKYISPYAYSNNNQFGFGLGFEYQTFNGYGIKSTNFNGQVNSEYKYIPITGVGLALEIPYYPIFNQNFTIGLLPTYVIGTEINLKNESQYTSSEGNNKYTYHNIQLETELAYGFQTCKFVSKFNLSAQINNYKSTEDNGLYSTVEKYNLYNNRKTIFLGARIGRFYKKHINSPGNIIDVFYSMTIMDYNISFAKFGKSKTSFTNWNPGIQICWLSQGNIKILFDAIFKSKVNSLLYNENFIKKDIYRLSIFLTNRNL